MSLEAFERGGPKRGMREMWGSPRWPLHQESIAVPAALPYLNWKATGTAKRWQKNNEGRGHAT